MTRSTRLAAAAALSLLLRPCLPAEECPAVDLPIHEPACSPVDLPASVGLRVFIDRATGRMRAPTAEEARALYESGGRGLENLEPLEVVVHPNGMRSVDLKGAFNYNVVRTRRPDGSFETRCVPANAAPEEK